MFCSKCGAQLKEEDTFCSSCGAKTDRPKKNAVQKTVKASETDPDVGAENSGITVKRTPKVGIIIAVLIAAAALCALGLILAFGNGSGSGSFSERDSAVVFVYDLKEKETHIIYNNKLLNDTIQGDVGISDCESSLSGSVYALVGGDKTLYLIDEKGVRTVAYDVINYFLSYSGNGMVYADSEGDVFLYDCKKGENTKIAKDCSFGDNCYLCISPDGKSAAFADHSDDEYTMYVFSNGEKSRAGKRMIPLTISDGAKDFFVTNTDKNLYYLNKDGEKEKLASSIGNECYINSLNNEIVYFEISDGSYVYYYYSVGEEKNRIYEDHYDGYTSVYVPIDTENRSSYLYAHILPSQTLRNGAIYLCNASYDSDFAYVNEKGEKEKIRCSEDNAGWYNNYYFKNGTFIFNGMKIQNGKPSNTGSVISENDDSIEKVLFVNDGKNAYYTKYVKSDDNKSGETRLYYSDADGSNELELYKTPYDADSVDITVCNDKFLLFTVNDSSLYISENGSEPRLLSDEQTYIVPGKQSKFSYNYLEYIYNDAAVIISKSSFGSGNAVFAVSPDGGRTELLDDIICPDYYRELVSQADSYAASIKNSIDNFLTDADTAGYGMYQGRSYEIFNIKIEDGTWYIPSAQNLGFYNDLSQIHWGNYGTGYTGKSKADIYEAESLLAIRLADLFPEIQNGSVMASLFGGKCVAVAYTSEKSTNLLEGTDYPYFGENGKFYDTFAWNESMTGVTKEGIVVGTAPKVANQWSY